MWAHGPCYSTAQPRSQCHPRVKAPDNLSGALTRGWHWERGWKLRAVGKWSWERVEPRDVIFICSEFLWLMKARISKHVKQKYYIYWWEILLYLLVKVFTREMNAAVARLAEGSVRFRRRYFRHETNRISWINIMWSSASEPIRNGWLNWDRLCRSSRLSHPEITPVDWLWFKRRSSHEPNQTQGLFTAVTKPPRGVLPIFGW